MCSINRAKMRVYHQTRIMVSKIEAGAARAIEDAGLTLRTIYSKVDEISKILSIIKGLEDLSSTTDGLMMVKRPTESLFSQIIIKKLRML